MNFIRNNRNPYDRIPGHEPEADRDLTTVETPMILRRPIFTGDEKNPAGSPPVAGAAPARCRQACVNSPYCASRTCHHVSFFCHAPEASQVSLVGDFNDWDAAATPMKRMPDGFWTADLELPHGHHQYYFLVDGRAILDPKAMGKTRNDRNESVSLIAVS